MLPVKIIPALTDNYIYAIKFGEQAIVVDVGEFLHLRTYLKAEQIKQVHLLITHKHYDHIHGLPALLKEYPQTKIYTSKEIFAQIPFAIAEENRVYVQDGVEFNIGEHKLVALSTPGHTDQHLVFILGNQVFTGDLIFSAGCGRVQPDGGDIHSLYNSINKVKSFLGVAEYWLYPGHEYTQGNLLYAKSLEDASIADALAKFEATLSERNYVNTPVSYLKELTYNPFLRADNPSQFINLRLGKDTFIPA
ncbi:hypothetical protein CKF54_05400 [Psittacicella hinzii]|uniref:hydroxyacylglutathione hydrolase n=1 Tax=Psittacicella hinzii TaxID=2028575 RepID=A0A3A1Y4C7_9GAMM|nr:hydroxyacylglutathione hydrolase family protein [Psittacicella hinzii]RIY32116.1 hypothetical protein CKF54_05400 [Psittacicella hinzii]